MTPVLALDYRWVLYKYNGKDYSPATNWDPGIKLDITNPEVVRWQVQRPS